MTRIRHKLWAGIACWMGMVSLTFAQPKKPEPEKQQSEAPVITEKNYRIYQGNGEPATMEQMLNQFKRADVIFLGESHNDRVAHHLEALLLQKLDEQRKSSKGGQGKTRPLALSVEMFERDVQHIIDEYLAGLITETHFVGSSRPWKNYKTDYRPLVEYAKKNQIPVVGGNAPRRYVNLVGREGAEALKKIASPHQRGLPPLPYAKASPAYEAKFKAIMEQMKSKTPKKEDKTQNAKERENDKTPKPPMDKTKPPVRKFDLNKALQAQSLWDASMAYSIAEHLLRSPKAQVLQINGSFHSEKRLGIPEHLLRYRPGTTLLVVTMVSDKSFPKFDTKSMCGMGDFVIVTDPSIPKSYSTPSLPKKDDKKEKEEKKETQKQAVRNVIRAILAAAEACSKAPPKSRIKGDPLTEQLMRTAAHAAQKLPEEDQIDAFLLAVGIALDRTHALTTNRLLQAQFAEYDTSADRAKRSRVLGTLTMRNRSDWALHFVVSIGLMAKQSPKEVEAWSIAKESYDSLLGTSGFSFTDLNADLAGISLARRLQCGEITLKSIEKGFRVQDFLPAPADLQDGMRSREFSKAFGSTKDQRFLDELAKIRLRVKRLHDSFQSASLPGSAN